MKQTSAWAIVRKKTGRISRDSLAEYPEVWTTKRRAMKELADEYDKNFKVIKVRIEEV